MKKLLTTSILIVLASCSKEDPKPEVVFKVGENIAIELLSIKPEEEIASKYLIPISDYRSESRGKLSHVVVSGLKPLELTLAFKDKTNALPASEFEAITKMLKCSAGREITFSHLDNNRLVVTYTPDSKRQDDFSLRCIVPGENSSYGGRFPGGASFLLVTLPENPLDQVFPLLTDMGYLFHKPFDRNMAREVIDRYGFDGSRDKFDLGFINSQQEGLRVFWDDVGPTKITFSEGGGTIAGHAKFVSIVLNLEQDKVRGWISNGSRSPSHLSGYTLTSSTDKWSSKAFVVITRGG